MLRRRGIRVVSITEHADDSPTGKLMEAIIESVDEFYSENLAQEVVRGMREAASRGFWISSRAPYGYNRVMVQDGAKKRPRLEVNDTEAVLVRRMFQMADSGKTLLDITKTLNKEGIASPNGKSWRKTTVYKLLTNEVYTGTVVWGANAKDKAPPVRVENAFPALVSREAFSRVVSLLESRAPVHSHPRRSASSYLLSGIVKCRTCGKALSGQESKSGQFAYYVCQSLMKQGSGACDAPRLNARKFEGMIVDQIRENILTDSNIRDLVRLVDEEMDGVAREQREKLETVEAELAEIRGKMDRLWHAVESTDLEINDILPRLREHKERQEKLEVAAGDARMALAERREVLDDVDTITAYAQDMREFLLKSDLTESRAFIKSFVKEIDVAPGRAVVRYSIPMPEDSRIPGKDVEEIALAAPVLSTVHYGGDRGARTPNLGIANAALSQLSYIPI